MIHDTSAQDRPLAVSRWRARRFFVGAAAAAALGLLALAAIPWQRVWSGGNSVSAARLVLASVDRGSFVRDIAGEGRVVAALSATLYAANAGAATLKVHAGDSVRRGQVLAVVDSPELSAKLAQEQSNAQAMQADYQRAAVDARQQRAALQSTLDNAQIDQLTAQNDLARQQKAFEAGAVSSMQVAHAKDTLAKAEISLRHASAGIGLADDSLKFDVQAKQLAHSRQLLLVQDLKRQVEALSVRAPVDGQVGQLFVAEHANVARDAQLLSVIDLSTLEVQMRVAESFARDLIVGMPGEISGNGQTWKGRISAISPEVVNNEVAAQLRFDGGTPGQLRQNQRLSVRVLLDQREGVLTVQRGAFVDESGGKLAYVVRDDVAVQQPVRLGARSLDKVEVLDGLAPGDRVVVSGAELFHGAAQVTLSR